MAFYTGVSSADADDGREFQVQAGDTVGYAADVGGVLVERVGEAFDGQGLFTDLRRGFQFVDEFAGEGRYPVSCGFGDGVTGAGADGEDGGGDGRLVVTRSEEHTSELQSQSNIV